MKIYASNFSTSVNANIPKLTNRPNSGQTAVAGCGRRIFTAGRRKLEKFSKVLAGGRKTRTYELHVAKFSGRGRGTTG